MEDRIGKMYISLYLTVNSKKEVSDMLSMMEFIPTRVECLYYRHVYEYIGYSVLFDKTVEWCEVPEYFIEIDRSKDGKIKTVRAEKVNKK